MKQTDPQFKLRFPPELKQRLDEAAAANQRTISAEIIHRLERSFEGDRLGLGGDLVDVVSILALIGATLGRTTDREKFDEADRELLDQLPYFSKSGSHTVSVSDAADTGGA